MIQIKMIKPDTDLSKVDMTLFDWDAVVNGEPYKVYCIDEYIHSYGSTGVNDLWACPRAQAPSVSNLIPYHGHGATYSVHVDMKDVHCYHWDDDSIETSCGVTILRNGRPFYEVSANNPEFGVAEAYRLIRSVIREGVINYNCYKYEDKEIIGRHIWWRGEPYTLVHYCDGQCCAIAAPGHLSKEEVFSLKTSFDYPERTVKLDLLMDGHIDWFQYDPECFSEV